MLAFARWMVALLAFLWQLPVAAPVWLLYLLPAWGLGMLTLEPMGVGIAVFVMRPRFAWWARLWDKWGGHAWPYAIVVRSLNVRLLEHEFRHVAQWRALGVLFPLAYVALLVGFGYRDHPLARDAEASEGLLKS